MEINTLIRDINANLKPVFQDYLGVYFFGSRSRKDSREYSDYDMVFVFGAKPDWRKKNKIRDIIYRKEVEYGVVIDGKYFSREEIEDCQTPFLETVFKEGRFYAV
jgi:predicted nucleotidyltransferase